MRFGGYELTEVAVNDLLVSNYPHSPSLAWEYAGLDPDTRPPCIFDPIAMDILDGNHRAQSARLRGEDKVMCYVGIADTTNPDWKPWDGE
jgi:hypothetical protein